MGKIDLQVKASLQNIKCLWIPETEDWYFKVNQKTHNKNLDTMQQLPDSQRKPDLFQSDGKEAAWGL